MRAVAAVAAVLVVRVAVVWLEVVLPHVQAAVLAHVVPAVHVAAPTSSDAVSTLQLVLCSAGCLCTSITARELLAEARFLAQPTQHAAGQLPLDAAGTTA